MRAALLAFPLSLLILLQPCAACFRSFQTCEAPANLKIEVFLQSLALRVSLSASFCFRSDVFSSEFIISQLFIISRKHGFIYLKTFLVKRVFTRALQTSFISALCCALLMSQGDGASAAPDYDHCPNHSSCDPRTDRLLDSPETPDWDAFLEAQSPGAEGTNGVFDSQDEHSPRSLSEEARERCVNCRSFVHMRSQSSHISRPQPQHNCTLSALIFPSILLLVAVARWLL